MQGDGSVGSKYFSQLSIICPKMIHNWQAGCHPRPVARRYGTRGAKPLGVRDPVSPDSDDALNKSELHKETQSPTTLNELDKDFSQIYSQTKRHTERTSPTRIEREGRLTGPRAGQVVRKEMVDDLDARITPDWESSIRYLANEFGLVSKSIIVAANLPAKNFRDTT